MLIYQNYYKEPYVRETCHYVKAMPPDARSEDAVKRIAEYLTSSGIAGKDTALIPAPQHTGKAKYTLEIARKISEGTGAEVCDVICCSPHAPLYDMKYQNTCPDIIFWKNGQVPADKALLFVDNVISTGFTFLSVQKLFNGRLLPFVYAIDYTRLRSGLLEGKHDGYSIERQTSGRLCLIRG